MEEQLLEHLAKIVLPLLVRSLYICTSFSNQWSCSLYRGMVRFYTIWYWSRHLVLSFCESSFFLLIFRCSCHHSMDDQVSCRVWGTIRSCISEEDIIMTTQVSNLYCWHYSDLVSHQKKHWIRSWCMQNCKFSW